MVYNCSGTSEDRVRQELIQNPSTHRRLHSDTHPNKAQFWIRCATKCVWAFCVIFHLHVCWKPGRSVHVHHLPSASGFSKHLVVRRNHFLSRGFLTPLCLISFFLDHFCMFFYFACKEKHTNQTPFIFSVGFKPQLVNSFSRISDGNMPLIFL